MATKIVSGNSYINQLKAKNIVPQHHAKGAGGYRDYKTNPVLKNEIKEYQINKAAQTVGRNEARTNAGNGRPIDRTKDINKDLPTTANESGTTTTNMRNIMIIGAVVVAAGLVYYYYR